MSEVRFVFERGDNDPELGAVAIRRAFDLIATFLNEDADADRVVLAELERVMNDDVAIGLNAVYGLVAIAAGFVKANADDLGEQPLDVIRRLEEAAIRTLEEGDDV
jgi:hypothetical protein